jgi:hypothetical protein
LYTVEILLITALVAAIGFFGYLGYGLIDPAMTNPTFSSEQALSYAIQQVDLGPRPTGSRANDAVGDWLIEELGQLGWAVYIQPFKLGVDEIAARNIIAVRGAGPTVMLATGYDTRLAANRDSNPDQQDEPVPGANDGAAGVALLVELARTLNVNKSGHEICLIFFDAERNGGLPGWEANLGSRYFIEQINALPRCANPEFAILVEGIGDADQQIFRPQSSPPALADAIWGNAAELGYSEWIINGTPDDSIDLYGPFEESGIPTVRLFDADYAYRNTTEDTLDKLGTESLQHLGRTLEVWLEEGAIY